MSRDQLCSLANNNHNPVFDSLLALSQFKKKNHFINLLLIGKI